MIKLEVLKFLTLQDKKKVFLGEDSFHFVIIERHIFENLLRIKQTKIEMKKGNNFDSSIKSLRPPVFWKDKDSFQKHCLKWPLKSIEKNLFELMEAEISCKLNSKIANLKCEQSIILIASKGKRYFKN